VLEQPSVQVRFRLECRMISSDDGRVTNSYHVLNDVVIDRGRSAYLCNLECFMDDCEITNVQADGVIIASATGSTAYSLSAGGSLVHPSLPAILFTPICPHSLSFRPVVLPITSRLKIKTSHRAATSFDGRHIRELKSNDHLEIRLSPYPFLSLARSTETSEFFQSLSRHLNWNVRKTQKPKYDRYAHHFDEPWTQRRT
jgi:NAD+ kinase